MCYRGFIFSTGNSKEGKYSYAIMKLERGQIVICNYERMKLQLIDDHSIMSGEHYACGTEEAFLQTSASDLLEDTEE